MKLSDTQLVLLGAAAQREDYVALPLPASLRGGAAAKVVSAMLAKGLLEEVAADPRRGDPVWRETGDGHAVTLVATVAGLTAIGLGTEPEDAASAPTGADDAPATPAARTRRRNAPKAPTGGDVAAAPKTRDGTKQAQLIEMLQRKEGATIAQLVEATGWQPHTVRGAFAGALKKKLGLTVTSEKPEGRERVYRIED